MGFTFSNNIQDCAAKLQNSITLIRLFRVLISQGKEMHIKLVNIL